MSKIKNAQAAQIDKLEQMSQSQQDSQIDDDGFPMDQELEFDNQSGTGSLHRSAIKSSRSKAKMSSQRGSALDRSGDM
jgi:hypothetical protein